MGIIGEKMDIDFVISTGDNFYDDGLKGVDDPAFDDSFTNIYTAPSLQKQWYNGKNLPKPEEIFLKKKKSNMIFWPFSLLCCSIGKS